MSEITEVEVIFTDADGQGYRLLANNISEWNVGGKGVYKEPVPDRCHPTGHPDFFIMNPAELVRTDFTITFQAHPDVDGQQYRMEVIL